MSQLLSLWRVSLAYVPTVSRAISALLFCTGLMLLPPLLLANLAAWLGCQHLSGSACAALLLAGLDLSGQ